MTGDERAQLDRIEVVALGRLRDLAAEKDFNRDWLEARLAYYSGDYEAALAGFTRAVDARYVDAGRAMALASLGREDEAIEAFRAAGLWIEGGSLEGHRLAGYAFLPRYKLDVDAVFPPSDLSWVRCTALSELDGDALERYRAAAQSASKPQRLRMLAALEQAQGRTALAYKQVKAGLADALGAEIALAAGDLDTARAIYEAYRKSASSSWYTPAGNATKAAGFAGSAAVAHAEGEYTRAIGWAKKALELETDRKASTHRAALLVLWVAETELGLESKTHAALRRAAPLQDIVFGHLALSELETELDVVDKKRIAADEGDALWDEDRAAAASAYERALGLGRKVRKSIRLGERRDGIAARLLYALCERGDLTRVEAIARACIAGSPELLNAWETLAWCTDDESMFRVAGLGGEWDTSAAHPRRVTYRDWKKRPIERALRQQPITRSKHAGDLLMYGVFDLALTMYESMGLAKASPDRYLAAWACWTPVAPVDGEHPVGRRYTAAQKREAARAWTLLEPLIRARWDVFYQRQPFDPWVLAVHLLHAVGDWPRLLEVADRCTGEHWSSRWYRPANVGIAPWIADALAHEKGIDEGLRHLHGHLTEEPKDRRLLESLDALCARAGMSRPTERLADANWEPASRARELSFRAWRLEIAGELEDAFAVYREAAELDLDPMALSNVANLVSREGDFERADAYWHIAFIGCGDVHPRFRIGGFLAKRAWQERLRDRPADAIPLAAHAFALHPTAGGAHTLAEAYFAIGDDVRARDAIRRGLAIDSRHAELRQLLSTVDRDSGSESRSTVSTSFLGGRRASPSDPE